MPSGDPDSRGTFQVILGTNSSGWDGPPTLNTPRYFYGDYFSHTLLP